MCSSGRRAILDDSWVAIPGDKAIVSNCLTVLTGGSRIPGHHPGAGSRGDRGETVTPTGSTIPAALVVRGKASRCEGCNHRTVDGQNEVPGDGLGHPMAVSEQGASLQESGSRVRESIKEEVRSSEARVLQALSLGPVLP